MHSKLYIPARSATPPYTVDITPESAGWSETSLQVVELDSMQELALDTNGTEVMILPLAGGGTVECGNEAFELSPRASVFDETRRHGLHRHGPELHAVPAREDLRSAERAPSDSCPTAGWLAADVSVELRGTGNCSRQVHNFGTRRCFRGRLADRVRGDHPGRQLVELPGAQARRGVAGRVPRSRRSTTSRSTPGQVIHAASAITACTAPRTARSKCSKRSAAVTSCWFRTATTVRPWPRPAITCTTST